MNDYIEGHRAMSSEAGETIVEDEGPRTPFTARCTCGWRRDLCNNHDEVIEALMKHGFEVGYAAAVTDVSHTDG